MDENEEDLKRIQAACDAISEHFDSVQIFATRFDGEIGTVNVNWGSGNWFARRGQISDWLIKQNEVSKEIVRKED